MEQKQCGCGFIIDSVEIPAPTDRNPRHTTMINDKIYCNGYEYKNGKWKRTLKAILIDWFV